MKEIVMLLLNRIGFKHIISLAMLSISAAGAFVVLLTDDFSAEIKGSVVTLMLIGGWTAVQNFWLGSSSSSDAKTRILGQTPPTPAPPNQTGFVNIAMIKALAIAIILLLFAIYLSGCQSLSKFTLGDAKAAGALAQASGDVAGQRCYSAIADQVAATSAVANTAGLLFLNQEKRDMERMLGIIQTNCNGVLPLKQLPLILP